MQAAELALAAFEDTWGTRAAGAVAAWERAWEEFTPFLAFAPEIRKIIYTTNLIESINFQLSKVTKSDWWQVLHVDDEPAGFVLPAVFDDCQRDGLDEATLLLIGVRPRHRGSGRGRLLLRRATWTLVEHGVWRIYSDTAADNTP